MWGTENRPGKTFIIAELGSGHGASYEKACRLVDAAAAAGADCVKFQLVYADEILHPETGLVPLPGGLISLYERFKQLEVPLEFFKDIKNYAESQGLVFLCTPFGLKSARQLRDVGVSLFKIASPELNYDQLVTEVASYCRPVLLSSGVSQLADIEHALSLLSAQHVCLLHCVTAYPAPEEDYNLNVLASLSAVFGVPVGVSDHSLDPVLVPALAVAHGASVVEKHFCLSKKDDGLDDPVALPPDDFAKMVTMIRQAEVWGREKTVSELISLYNKEKVINILGDGVKRLSPAEKANYERTNRSIHAVKKICAGECFTRENLAILRTEKILRPGLAPRYFDQILGRKAGSTIPPGEGVRFEDI